MLPIFEPLVQEAIRCLTEDMTDQSLIKNSDSRSYAATLFALISKTACRQWPQDFRDSCLLLTLRFLSKQQSYPLTFNTQLILS